MVLDMSNTVDICKLTRVLVGLRDEIKPSIDRAWLRSPAVKALDAPLSLNRPYNNVVVPRLDKFEKKHEDITTISALHEFVVSFEKPAIFLERELDTKDERRAETVVGVVRWLGTSVAGHGGAEEQLARLEDWARDADPCGYKDVKIRGFALAGWQYLRMLYGANTLKPDVRIITFVKCVVDHSVSPLEALNLLTIASQEAGVKVRDVDTTIWDKNLGGKEQSGAMQVAAG